MNTIGSPFRRSGFEQHPAPVGRQSLRWFLILLLAAVALIRPLMHLTGVIGDLVPSGPITVLVVTIGITAVWIAAVLSARVTKPFLTLVCAGFTYAVLSTILTSILSPILVGELQGPLANPFAIPSILITNACWGAIAGGIAAGLGRLRDRT